MPRHAKIQVKDFVLEEHPSKYRWTSDYTRYSVNIIHIKMSLLQKHSINYLKLHNKCFAPLDSCFKYLCHFCSFAKIHQFFKLKILFSVYYLRVFSLFFYKNNFCVVLKLFSTFHAQKLYSSQFFLLKYHSKKIV